MLVRLLLGVALAADIIILAVNTEPVPDTTISPDCSAPPVSSEPPETAKSRRVKCRKIKKCPENEQFTYCTKSIQRPQYCVDNEESNEVSRKPCWEQGCVCKENYLRAENGTCIPAEQCPITCGDNEILDSCPAECDSDYCPTEDVKDKPCVIPDVCPPPKCKCGFNHRRISNGSCIHAQSCPVIDCVGPNEEFVHCPPLCPTDDCSQATPTGECPTQFGHIFLILPCNPQCRCIKGYWRLDGVCVPYAQCPGVCPANERYSTCIQGECRALNCTQKDKPIPCVRMDPKYCIEGCVCTEGYLRNKDGVCVLMDECESSSGQDDASLSAEDCPDNERYSTCIQAECRALNCTQKDKSVPCVRMDPRYCIEGCVCTEGYLRNEDGVCVLEDKCESSSCPPNEELVPCMQGVCRAKFCSERGEDVPCPDIPPEQCDSGCICKEFFLRDANGNCVPENQCDSEDCPDNERYSTCIQGECRALNCTQKDQSVPCVRIDPKYCIKGCVCTEGYLRNEGGVCVLENECESSSCPPNEELVPCMQGVCRAKYCSERGEDVPCPDIPPEQCDSGCICKEFFLRDANGNCVPEDQCDSEDCPDNERYSTCIQGECRALNCTQKDQSIPCVKIDPKCCKKGCVCEEGYLRNEEGVCVLEEECDSEDCPDNERYSTCIQGECRALNCTQKDQSVPCVKIDPKCCKKGCVCEEGYLRNEEGICVLKNECDSEICPENEVFSECIQGGCSARNCSQKGQSVPCVKIDPKYCIKGCVCAEGYLRNEDGVCVPEDECESNICPDNEVYSECVQGGCSARNCSQKGQPVRCVKIDPKYCIKGCVCAEGYLRNEYGVCVPEDECDSDVCPENEILSECIQGGCRAQKCTQKGKPVPCVRIDPKYCIKGCVCEVGYLRNEDGVCVPEDECESEECPDNERYSTCVQGECRPLNCTEKGQSVACVDIDEENCIKGCVCEEGYLRNEDGICVLEYDCETEVCPENERYSACKQSECRALDCIDKGQPVNCVRLDPQFCIKGCVCEEGYLRDQFGVCVLEDDCKPPVCPPNEEYSTCAQALCRAVNCSQRGKPIACPFILEGYCKKACVCKSGYLRNAEGDCIPEDQCTCEENEILVECPEYCNTDYCPYSADEVEECSGIADPCVPTCKCRFNYRRHYNGSCIPTRDCPPFDCSTKPNEEYVACPPLCPTDECGKPRLEGRCPFRIGIILQCKPKCQCIDGYGRVNGTCVPFEECPDLCPTNEEYSPCVEQTCRPQTCSERDVAMETCPSCDDSSCKRGCICKEGYYRNDKGVCVSYEECGGPMCPNAHEVFVTNFKECPPNICNSLVAKYRCPKNQTEGPGCLCESGYLRLDLNSSCVPICDCPEMMSSPEC